MQRAEKQEAENFAGGGFQYRRMTSAACGALKLTDSSVSTGGPSFGPSALCPSAFLPCVSRLQQPPMAQRPLQRRLHLHRLKLGDGEVQVLNRRIALGRIILQ